VKILVTAIGWSARTASHHRPGRTLLPVILNFRILNQHAYPVGAARRWILKNTNTRCECEGRGGWLVEDDRAMGTPHAGTPGEPRDGEPAMASTRPGGSYGARRGETV
jgi:hypothetical protein